MELEKGKPESEFRSQEVWVIRSPKKLNRDLVSWATKVIELPEGEIPEVVLRPLEKWAMELLIRLLGVLVKKVELGLPADRELELPE